MYTEIHREYVYFKGIKTEPIKIELGLRQGCVLSPILFALFIADLARKIEKFEGDVILGTQRINGLLFADDIILFGGRQTMQKMLDMIGMYTAIKIKWKWRPKSV